MHPRAPAVLRETHRNQITHVQVSKPWKSPAEIVGDMGDARPDQLLDGGGIDPDFPLGVFAVAQFQEFQQIAQIDRRPERRHEILGKDSARLFAADAAPQQLLIGVQRHLVLPADQFAAGLLVESGVGLD